MCSFLVTNLRLSDLDYVNYFQKFRGPDLTNAVEYGGYFFVHNLLNLTGQFSPQPFWDAEREIACLYNGEIYNFKDFGDYPSDGYCLIDLYKEFDVSFPQKLDGEFAIVLFDFRKKRIIVTTDPFATKPIWISIENDKIGLSSYQSALKRLGFKNAMKMPANLTIVLSMPRFEQKIALSVCEFGLDQYKTDVSDWIAAFDRAIEKRVRYANNNLYMCLSSGYDSGCIACALDNMEVPYYSYTIIGKEKVETIHERVKYSRFNRNEILQMSKGQYLAHHRYIKQDCEEFTYSSRHLEAGANKMTDDMAAVGMSFINSRARAKGNKIYLSGQGADEIYSDYGVNGQKIYPQSCFGGLFPKNLDTLFPWENFFGGTQQDYLGKEEHIAGLYGVEGRYPFLDKQAVQEFLWLTPEIKNSKYKSCLHYYLESHDYPFDENVKIGFSAMANLKDSDQKRIQ